METYDEATARLDEARRGDYRGHRLETLLRDVNAGDKHARAIFDERRAFLAQLQATADAAYQEVQAHQEKERLRRVASLRKELEKRAADGDLHEARRQWLAELDSQVELLRRLVI
jgi:hypothetical protein